MAWAVLPAADWLPAGVELSRLPLEELLWLLLEDEELLDDGNEGIGLLALDGLLLEGIEGTELLRELDEGMLTDGELELLELDEEGIDGMLALEDEALWLVDSQPSNAVLMAATSTSRDQRLGVTLRAGRCWVASMI